MPVSPGELSSRSPSGSLRDHRRGECRRCDEGNSATQARVIFRGHDMDFCRTAKVRQRSFAQSTANDRFDQAPRCSYFAADINAPGIECVDDRSQAQAEVTCGGVDRSERLCVAYGEVDPDACGVAVPLEEGSRVVGSLSVVLPAATAKGRLLKITVKLVREAGQRIEGELQGD